MPAEEMRRRGQVKPRRRGRERRKGEGVFPSGLGLSAAAQPGLTSLNTFQLAASLIANTLCRKKRSFFHHGAGEGFEESRVNSLTLISFEKPAKDNVLISAIFSPAAAPLSNLCPLSWPDQFRTGASESETPGDPGGTAGKLEEN